MDAEGEPHKAAGLYTGIPASVGAGLAFVPIYLWFVTGENPLFRAWYVTMPWVLFIAALMISTVATYSWSSIRLRRSWRMLAIAGVGLFGAALVTATWHTLLAISAIYLALLPFSVASYERFKRRRAAQPVRAPAAVSMDSAG
jgi:CDP-diacylglycerol--serine O-phosphatidyltransferase